MGNFRWIAFPQSRLHLLVTRVAAIWVTAFRSMLALAAAYWAGAAAGMAAFPVSLDELQNMVLWFAYSFLLYLGIMTAW